MVSLLHAAARGTPGQRRLRAPRDPLRAVTSATDGDFCHPPVYHAASEVQRQDPPRPPHFPWPYTRYSDVTCSSPTFNNTDAAAGICLDIADPENPRRFGLIRGGRWEETVRIMASNYQDIATTPLTISPYIAHARGLWARALDG